MKRLRSLPSFVWVLLGLLAISSSILSLGQRDDTAKPSADSYSPSGTAALAELLKRNGYDVRIDRHPRPRLASNDVAVTFSMTYQGPTIGETDTTFRHEVFKQIRAGGRAVVFSIPANFRSESQALLASTPQKVTIRGRPGSLSMLVSSNLSDEFDDWAASNKVPNIGLWDTSEGPLVRAYQIGKGRVLYAKSGSFVTNRFLDRGDDARAALALIGTIARPGDHLVFAQASFGDVDNPGLMESIGAWAYAGWQQILFLGVVVVYTLGKRFGIPEETRPPQRGARDLLEALTYTYHRGKQTKAAMAAALERTNNEISSALRLPRDAVRADRDRHLPESLAVALTRLQAASEMEARTPPERALELIVKARKETDLFLGARRGRATEFR
ncbi:DUF4350 domain-containing protein [Fimbriimonas ginsengisoli]|uniref:DUF4350 domain-containing protein n=1 Tax=Fimbriimonas ginsengisoli Gsoil 348 TaxID=661478 RepID=A0A068NXH9_FIMGI|nr:DUF4350 domain-containing protein [Fimbriimonas ginsengisoli]AIE88126.1 hypothetical protein OP10G_4758 [Fimbriimonas ginsengisoli Gsoil 348]